MIDDQEWSIRTGLRRAMVHLLIWLTICAVVWGLAVWLSTPWLNELGLPDASSRRYGGRSGSRFLFWGLIVLPTGWIAGKLLYDRMISAAGFVSWILTTMSIVAIWLMAATSVLASDAMRPLAGSRDVVLIVGVGTVATLYAMYETVADR